MTITGTTDLETLEQDRTRIIFSGDVKASGLGGAIIEKVAAGQMDGLFAEFEENIKRALDNGSEPE